MAQHCGSVRSSLRVGSGPFGKCRSRAHRRTDCSRLDRPVSPAGTFPDGRSASGANGAPTGNGTSRAGLGSLLTMLIRPRNADDAAECTRLLGTVWERDRYPIYLPDDLTTFVVTEDALDAWVATDADDFVVGHVALHLRSWEGVMRVAIDALDCVEDDLAVVARLMVAPSARRAGVGRSLLTHAALRATKLGRMPILDVAAHYGAAIALYEEAGWRRIGTALFPMPNGSPVTEIIFAAPER